MSSGLTRRWGGVGALCVLPLLCLGGVALSVRGPAQEAGSLDTLIRGVQHREGQVRSLRGYLVEAEYTLQPAFSRTLFQVEFLIADGRARYSAAALVAGGNHWGVHSSVEGPFVRLPGAPEPVPSEPPRIEVAIDGQTETRYQNAYGVLEILAQSSTPTAVARQPFCEGLAFGVGRRLWSEWLARGLSTGGRAPALQPAVRLGEYECDLVVTPLPGEPDLDWTLRLWVCPALGYAVCRAEFLACRKGQQALSRADVCEAEAFGEAAPGLWLPAHTRVLGYYYDEGYPDPCVLLRSTRLFGLEANPAVSDADFTMRSPVGAAISNPAGVALPPGLKESGAAARELREAPAPEPGPPPEAPEGGP